MSLPHEDWMRRTMDLAHQCLPQDVPVGAVVVSASGEVLGEGWNTRERDLDPSGHAEINALKQAALARQNWRLKDCILYVTLEPCPMCASALLQARISTLVFGAYDPVQGALGSALNLTEHYLTPFRVIGGILEQECQKQLQDFFKVHRLS